MIDNFVEARKCRRNIIDLLKKQQLEDSCCAEKLTQLGLDAKRRLLEKLAAWLVSFQPGQEPNAQDRNALCQAQLSVGDWLSAQREEAMLVETLKAARDREDQAYRLYDKVAPLGSIQIFLMNDADKAKAKAFQESYKGAKASREGIEEKFNAVRESIRAMIGSFLSNASKPESLKTLRTQSSIKQELKKILQESEARGREVWEPHSKGQGTSLKKLEREYDRLSNFYSTEGERCDTAI